MSAFFLSINLDGSCYPSSVAENMMRAIDRFGHDERQLVVQQNYAIGYQSLWTVPEEQGERQPLYDPQSKTWLAFYGRIDNRTELCTHLALDDQANISDAKLLHRFLLHAGNLDLGRVIGPFVFVLFEPGKSRVLAARDSMGGRQLVYRITSEHLHIATYEMAIVAHPSVDYRFNQPRVARMLTGIMEDKLSSTIDGLTPLVPGELINITGRQLEKAVFYRHNSSKRVRLANNQAYADEFKRLLRQAVTRRLRSVGPSASLMSGGLDSVPVSILMAQELKRRGQQLTALSWVFDRYPEADERNYSSDVCQRFDIRQVCINCDDVWPRLDEDTHVDPVVPFSIPYTEYQQEAFRHAQQRGVRTVMTGIHGDLLYGYSHSVFAELIKTGRWGDLIQEFRRLWQRASSRKQLLKLFVIAQLPGVKWYIEWRRVSRPVAVPCLQDEINDQLSNQSAALWGASLDAVRPANYRVVFDGFAGEDVALGRTMEAKYQVERRYPFRDRDLCEFMSGIPSDQLYFDSMPRPIVRRAFSQEFSAKLLSRDTKTDFSGVVSDGIRRDENWREWFTATPSAWNEYVKKCYFDSADQQNHSVELLMWRCGYYNYWRSVCYNHTRTELGLNNDTEGRP